ncbi:MAG: hypothetical protein JSR46_06285 [Verrucomicrobia bacterium]|nr:hypothetical protein [Verrucomicrobiota bacterium]
MMCDFDDTGREEARRILSDAIADAGRGLKFTLENEGGRHARRWLEVINHCLKEQRKLY